MFFPLIFSNLTNEAFFRGSNQTYNPIENQRQLAEVINLSLGKTNFVLRSLIKVGLVKLSNFRDSDNKFGYTYILTPKGISEKLRITSEFLQKKELEYSLLQKEIKILKAEVEK